MPERESIDPLESQPASRTCRAPSLKGLSHPGTLALPEPVPPRPLLGGLKLSSPVTAPL